MLDEQDLAALALTSRLVESATKPLASREFWALRRGIEPSALHGMTASEIAAELSVPSEYAERIAKLFDRAAGLAIALEKLDHSGIWTITGVGQRYPERLRTRLRDSAPVVLHGVGDTSLLDADGVGVVGSRDISAEGSQVAREIAQGAVKLGLPVVSGAARGVDSDAMNAAFEAGGQVVGVLADALERTVTRRGTRRGVAGGQICLVTPFTPSAPFSVGNAMGRNKIIYACRAARLWLPATTRRAARGRVQLKPSRMVTVALPRGLGRAAARATAPSSNAVPPNCPTSTASENCSTNLLIALLSKVEPLGDQLTFGI